MNTPDLSGWTKNNEQPPYTRAQAIADGALIDVTRISREVGFKVPVAVTRMVWTVLSPSERDERDGQSLEGRLREALAALRSSADGDGLIVGFDVPLIDFGRRATYRLQAVVSAGEKGEPVVTIMFPHEA